MNKTGAKDGRTADAASPDPAVRTWIARQLAQAPPRAPSLVITVWGDAIAPHTDAVMLPGLIALLAPCGLNERLVRTSVFRLVREGWLRSAPVGRRSLYRLTPEGARRFAQAYARIYAPVEATWDDTWEVVLSNGLAPGKRRALRDELSWAGFGAFGSGVHARPARGASGLPKLLDGLGVAGEVLAVRAHDDATLGGQSLTAAVARAWDLRGIAAEYRGFLRRFGGVIERFRQRPADALDPQQCFVVRTLLIHAYRRMLLRDPQLPADLLPLDWPGGAAAVLCRDFYRLTHRAAERHLVATLESAAGPLPPASADFYRRFGGLEP